MTTDSETQMSLQTELIALRQRVSELERQIAHQTQAEEALRESEARYRSLFEATFEGIVIHDRQTIIDANHALAKMFGYTADELIGRPVLDLAAPDSHVRIRQHMQNGYDQPYEAIGLRSDGTTFPAELVGKDHMYQGRQVRVVGIRDISKRKRLEAQLLQSQKMESIGRLAGGVAHDFSNLLVAIQGYTNLVLDRIERDHPVRSDVQEIEKAAQRAANLTHQLLAFARKQIIDPHKLNLNDLILDMSKLLRRLLGANIELITRPGVNLGQINADPGQIEQLLVNLAINARDAMPHGGTLTIETDNAVLDQAYVREHPGVVAGPYIMLTISDTGVGMDEEVKQHLFEPFFMAKASGKGTGLGLATCYSIVAEHGGSIAVESTAGQGTTFRVYLPRATASLPVRTRSALTDIPPQGTETVLVVEDEPAVRSLAARVLRAQGYTVLEAAHGEEALRIAQTHTEHKIQLLLTDVVMPQMGGAALAEQLATVHPGINVLFMSGYTDNVMVHQGRLSEGVAFVQKPFSPSTLARRVREVLDT